MSIRVKLKIDEDSIREIEDKLNLKMSTQLKRLLEEYKYSLYSKSKLDNLIDVLIEKGVIERSDLV